MASTVWVHGEFGCAICGVVSCLSAEGLKGHLAGSRHQMNARNETNAKGRLRRIKRNKQRKRKNRELRRTHAEKAAKAERVKEWEERQPVEGWEVEGEKLHPDVRRPPAYEPVRGLWHPGAPSQQPEEEALEGTWRIYAEMGWMPSVNDLEAPDVMLGAAPVVSCQGTIHLRRPGKEEQEEEEEEAEAPGRVPGANTTIRRGRPMLSGTWQLEHPEGHDKNHGTFPFGAHELTTLAPAAIEVFPSSSCAAMDEDTTKQETAKDEANETMEKEGIVGKEDVNVTDSGWMGWGCGGCLIAPKEWPLFQDSGDDRALNVSCLQLHSGPELKLRRLSRQAKELSDLGNQRPPCPAEAMEMSRAIWERRDDTMDPDAEPLVVRKGDMRIKVVFQEASEELETPSIGVIYFCRREGGLPAPAVVPCMDAPPRNEQYFLGLCFEEAATREKLLLASSVAQSLHEEEQVDEPEKDSMLPPQGTIVDDMTQEVEGEAGRPREVEQRIDQAEKTEDAKESAKRVSEEENSLGAQDTVESAQLRLELLRRCTEQVERSMYRQKNVKLKQELLQTQKALKEAEGKLKEQKVANEQLREELQGNQELYSETGRDLMKQVQEKDHLLQELKEELCTRTRDLTEEKDQLSQQLKEAQETSQTTLKDLKIQADEKDQLSQQLKEAKQESKERMRSLVEENDRVCQKLKKAKEESKERMKDHEEENDRVCQQLQEAAEKHTCQICLEYHADRALLCGHTFCHHCMSKLEEQELQQPQGSIRKMGCPVCWQSLASLAPDLEKMLKQTTRKRGRSSVDEHAQSSVSYPLKIFKS